MLYSPKADVVDVGFQHRLVLQAQKVLWGAAYRRARDDITSGLFFGFIPSSVVRLGIDARGDYREQRLLSGQIHLLR